MVVWVSESAARLVSRKSRKSRSLGGEEIARDAIRSIFRSRRIEYAAIRRRTEFGRRTRREAHVSCDLRGIERRYIRVTRRGSHDAFEENHDHDLHRYTSRHPGHYRRWILWTVNATIRTVQRRRRPVRERVHSATSVPWQIGPKRTTSRRFKVKRSPSACSVSSASSASSASSVSPVSDRSSQQSAISPASISVAVSFPKSSTDQQSVLTAPDLIDRR